ncbi:MAG: HDIG domain-containing protein [Cyanothece sp. SIO2G6]|nr:HDIG domain-containing protein [Cyanothece sp. SIO2G6]
MVASRVKSTASAKIRDDQSNLSSLERSTTAFTRFWQNQASEFKTSTTTSLNCSPKNRKKKRQYSALLAFIFSVVSLTSAIGYRYYNEPQLAVGTIAPQTIRAPEDAIVEDTKTTEARREAASKGAIPVLMIDQTVNQQIYQSLQRSLTYADDLREQAGNFPYIDSSTISTRAQNYLRQAPEAEWLELLTTVEGASSPDDSGSNPVLPPSVLPNLQSGNPGTESTAEPTTATQPSLVIPVTPDTTQISQQLATIELLTYRRTVSSDDFAVLKQLIIRARQRYAVALTTLNSSNVGKPTNLYPPTLLQLTDDEWGQTKVGIRQVLERVLTQGVANGTPDDLRRQAIAFDIERYVPQSAITLTSDLLLGVIKPNLIKDDEKTRLLAEQAAQEVKPEMVPISKGQVIITAGDEITQSNFVLLDAFGMSRRGINWLDLMGFAALTSGGVAIFLFAEYRFRPKLRSRDHLLVLLLTLTVPLTIALNIPSPNLPLVGLLVGSFYGSALGITVIALLGIVTSVGMEFSGRVLLASVIGSIVGTVMADRLRSREELALLGGGVGLAQGVVYLIIGLILSATTGSLLQTLLAPTLIQALMGVAWSIVALGISPYLEHLFDLVTPIRLVELSNPNRPLLKRVASETPGTFQHTLFVSSLAEAAARELRCNVELVRAGTLYHDIGKMHDPEGFIENQMGGVNKHDVIDDPWKSAAIIKKHVTEGLVMARKCRLPGAVKAFIPEHQGTMLITYFYYQAQEQAKVDASIEVCEEDFRYDGPIPQSRETGIVMLADSCEAALRSLKDATPEEALAMVNRILRARWQDRQMIDSGLSRQDMERIATIFVRVWQQYNHKRIPYPKAALAPKVTSASS